MTGSKYFFRLTHKQFEKVCRLLESNNYAAIQTVLEKAPKSSINPIKDTEIVDAIIFEGNILMDVVD